MAKRGPKPKKQQEKPEILQENQAETEDKIIDSESQTEDTVLEKLEIKQEEKKDTEKYLSMYEAAEYFRKKGRTGVTEETIKLWVNHGHLAKVRGGLIPMSSILHCRFNVRT